MDKRTKITPQKTVPTLNPVKVDPNDLLQQFLKENNLVLSVSAIDSDNSYIAKQGFVLTDRPLLIVSVKYK